MAITDRSPAIPDFAPIDPLYPTLFHEQWWLEAASYGQYREVVVRSGARIVGRLPFVYRRYLGMRECMLPDLIPFLGPGIDDGGGREVQRLIRRRRIVHELLDQLPDNSRFRQRLYAGSPDALSFLERGFASSAEFTHEIAPDAPDVLWSNIRDTTRRVIRRAQECGYLIELDPADFGRLYEANLRRRGKLFNHSWRSCAPPIFEAAIERKRGKLLGAVDRNGRVSAAIFYAWDAETTHLLMTTRNGQAHSGMISWLMWEAIKESAQSRRVFDFGGVGTKGSFLFYSGFGGRPQPRIVVERATLAFRVGDWSARKASCGFDMLMAPVTARLAQMRDSRSGRTNFPKEASVSSSWVERGTLRP